MREINVSCKKQFPTDAACYVGVFTELANEEDIKKKHQSNAQDIIRGYVIGYNKLLEEALQNNQCIILGNVNSIFLRVAYMRKKKGLCNPNVIISKLDTVKTNAHVKLLKQVEVEFLDHFHIVDFNLVGKIHEEQQSYIMGVNDIISKVCDKLVIVPDSRSSETEDLTLLHMLIKSHLEEKPCYLVDTSTGNILEQECNLSNSFVESVMVTSSDLTPIVYNRGDLEEILIGSTSEVKKQHDTLQDDLFDFCNSNISELVSFEYYSTYESLVKEF